MVCLVLAGRIVTSDARAELRDFLGGEVHIKVMVMYNLKVLKEVVGENSSTTYPQLIIWSKNMVLWTWNSPAQVVDSMENIRISILYLGFLIYNRWCKISFINMSTAVEPRQKHNSWVNFQFSLCYRWIWPNELCWYYWWTPGKSANVFVLYMPGCPKSTLRFTQLFFQWYSWYDHRIWGWSKLKDSEWLEIGHQPSFYVQRKWISLVFSTIGSAPF